MEGIMTDPTPQTQDTSPRAHIAAQAAAWGGDAGAVVRGFAAQLSEGQAAAFAASRPDAKSPDVLTVADLWLRWVEGEEVEA
jgi:hypothetical protein